MTVEEARLEANQNGGGVYGPTFKPLQAMGRHTADMPRFGTGPGKSGCPGVRPVKTGVFSRRQACRGKSQAPRSLDSRVAGNQNPEAYRQGLPWGRPRVTGP